jgi:hypothetical protein
MGTHRPIDKDIFFIYYRFVSFLKEFLNKRDIIDLILNNTVC